MSGIEMKYRIIERVDDIWIEGLADKLEGGEKVGEEWVPMDKKGKLVFYVEINTVIGGFMTSTTQYYETPEQAKKQLEKIKRGEIIHEC